MSTGKQQKQGRESALNSNLAGNTLAWRHGGGGGSSIVKVPGDVPPTRECFFKPSSLAKGILFANFSPFSRPRVYFLPIFAHLVWARVCFLAILVKEMSNFGNSCKETQIFFKFWFIECKNLASFASKMPIHGTLM